MKRTVRIARTAHDLTHVNRLHVPRFGVLKLNVVMGTKASKSYLIDEAPPQQALAGSTDDFCFAPEKETTKIKYTIDDWSGAITKATLELFFRETDKKIWKKELTADQYTRTGIRNWIGMARSTKGRIFRRNTLPSSIRPIS